MSDFPCELSESFQGHHDQGISPIRLYKEAEVAGEPSKEILPGTLAGLALDLDDIQTDRNFEV
jgi:hypothetical protein